MAVIKVLPSSKEMLRLKHPAGMKFVDLTTPVEWPADQYTYRRLREGAVKEVEPPKSEE
jgi:hypothetical protein